ncbi:MAG: hypothetical protein ACLR7U_14455 [Ruthenibacterium lactatiformans]
MGYEAIRLQRPLAVDDIVSVHYFEYSSNYYFEGERHDFWEFLYVDKGELDVRAGDVVQHLKKGRFSADRAGSALGNGGGAQSCCGGFCLPRRGHAFLKTEY